MSSKNRVPKDLVNNEQRANRLVYEQHQLQNEQYLQQTAADQVQGYQMSETIVLVILAGIIFGGINIFTK